jgi:hypothetical protein
MLLIGWSIVHDWKVRSQLPLRTCRYGLSVKGLEGVRSTGSTLPRQIASP